MSKGTKRSTDELYVECTLNREDGSLPFGLSHPDTKKKIVWICGDGEAIGDEPAPIVGVFRQSDEKKEIRIYSSVEQAREVRDGLKAYGWREMAMPKMVIRTDG